MAQDTTSLAPLTEPSIPQKGKNWWTDLPVADVIYSQHFAYELNPTKVEQKFIKYVMPVSDDITASSGTSKVTNGDNSFRIELSVDYFQPKELKVQVVEEFVVITGHHERTPEGGGYVARSFTRRYQLPRECNSDEITIIYSDGSLIIEVSKQEVNMAPVLELPSNVRKEEVA